MLGFVQNSQPKINQIQNKPNRKKNGFSCIQNAVDFIVCFDKSGFFNSKEK
jgi:hypothetical protein